MNLGMQQAYNWYARATPEEREQFLGEIGLGNYSFITRIVTWVSMAISMGIGIALGINIK